MPLMYAVFYASLLPFVPPYVAAALAGQWYMLYLLGKAVAGAQ